MTNWDGAAVQMDDLGSRIYFAILGCLGIDDARRPGAGTGEETYYR